MWQKKSNIFEVSGSGIEWKLHSKGFDEELEEGQVKSHLFHCEVSPPRTQELNNLKFHSSDPGAAVQDPLLRLKAICHKSWLQWGNSVQVSGKTKY